MVRASSRLAQHDLLFFQHLQSTYGVVVSRAVRVETTDRTTKSVCFICMYNILLHRIQIHWVSLTSSSPLLQHPIVVTALFAHLPLAHLFNPRAFPLPQLSSRPNNRRRLKRTLLLLLTCCTRPCILAPRVPMPTTFAFLPHHTLKLTPQRLHIAEFIPNSYHGF